MVDPRDITGLVLAGGRGSRMGGVDKGLQLFRGLPLALHAMRRLALQVTEVKVNANRNLEVYESFGMPVQSDTDRDYAGPLAGILTGLEHCTTPFLMVVPCDAPFFPPDLVRRLATAMAADDAEIATAATSADGIPTRQPVFCLLKKTLSSSLCNAIDSGQRKVDTWTGQHRRVDVPFDDPTAFVNVNTLEELQRLQTPRGSGVL